MNQLTTKQTDLSQSLIQTLGTLEETTSEQVKALSLSQLAQLETAYKDFTSVNDLTDWLQAQSKADTTDTNLS
ncbi:MAG: DUF4351 domain-containing protein [Cyanobacteria bacterium P01_C01_bin.118]